MRNLGNPENFTFPVLVFKLQNMQNPNVYVHDMYKSKSHKVIL